jgi:hypothetical protein
VTGGMRLLCHACGHDHSQTDPKCNPRCSHGSVITGLPPSPGPGSY